MEHPEQALFDEVKGLRGQMEEVRDRIFKIENTYNNKVENIERREFIAKTVSNKLSTYKENLTTKKIIYVDNRAVPIFKSTVTQNIYKSCKLSAFWDSPKTEVILDLDYDYFMAILDIVKRGHNFEALDEEDKASIQRNFRLRSKDLEKDPVFNDLLKQFFPDPNVLSQIAVDYSLAFKSIPSKLDELVKDISYLEDNSMSHCDKYNIVKEKAFSKITDPKNDFAIFLDYNKNAVVELSFPIRIRTIGLRPFIKDTGMFYPTTGSYYARFYLSNNGKDWDDIAVMPSDYGNANNDYISIFNLGKFKTIKFIKFTTNSSSQFSVSYIKFDY